MLISHFFFISTRLSSVVNYSVNKTFFFRKKTRKFDVTCNLFPSFFGKSYFVLIIIRDLNELERN
jgi:hypothetical protein